MKTILAFILSTLLLLVLIIPVDAQKEIPPEAFAQLDKFRDVQSAAQMVYFKDFGRYFQTLEIATKGKEEVPPEGKPDPTPESIPCPPDGLVCPKVTLPEERVITLRVNVYQSPAGWGYEVVAEYVDAKGSTWRRVENQGPERWRARAWALEVRE